MSSLWLIWFIPCAFANRIRGGMFGDKIRRFLPFWSTTVDRIMMSGFMLLPTWFYYPNWKCLLAWLLLYIGFIFGWKAWQDMNNLPEDILSMGVRGLVLTVPVGITLGNIPLVLCGATMGLIYFIGKFLPKYMELDGTERMGNVNWGEYIFGAVLGLCIGGALRRI